MPVQLLLALGKTILTNAAFERLAVYALWEVAKRTPGRLDDGLVQGAAKALGINLPEDTEPPKDTPKSA